MCAPWSYAIYELVSTRSRTHGPESAEPENQRRRDPRGSSAERPREARPARHPLDANETGRRARADRGRAARAARSNVES